MHNHEREPIAIIGMACRFPGGAHSPSEYWQLLIDGTDAIIDVPEDRWSIDRYYHPNPQVAGKMYVKQGGFLRQPIAAFDANFFNITPREAEQLDPQQRVLLEVTYEAFEDAGILAKDWQNSRTGVYVGAFTMDNMGQQLSYYSRDHIMSHTGMSTTMVMLSNRISYIFNLIGGSMTVDTACSSSLVSLHLACQALWNGECDTALSGGVNMMFRPEFVIAMCKGRFLSPTMRSKTFDASADGYVRGEGAGILVLKPLSKALADGDRIHAIINATGVNQDGRTEGITVPNGESQIALMHEVWQKAGLNASDMDYIEAHGTGTQVGDVIEANSIGQMLETREADCYVASVKTNIGHLEAAAGVASVIKAILMLQKQEIPPHLHLNTVNPKIDLETLGIRIPQSVVPTELNHIAINSFGYGGTNAHTVLSSAPSNQITQSAQSQHNLLSFIYSARSAKSLEKILQNHHDYLDEAVNLYDYGYTLSRHRDAYEHRAILFAHDINALQQQLADSPSIIGVASSKNPAQIVFVYTGMGAQSFGMARDLYHQSPIFKKALDDCASLFQPYLNENLTDWFTDEQSRVMSEPAQAQPANFALQIALTALWKSLGVEPDAIVGHSVGEIAASVIAGSLSLEDGVYLTYHRSQIQQKLLYHGGMLAVGLSAQAVESYLNEEISIAAVNSSRAVTLAGDRVAVDTLAKQLDEQGIFNRILRVDVPYHSHLMEPLKTEFYDRLAQIQPHHPTIRLYSTVNGQLITEQTQGVDYWWENCRQAVQLESALGNIIQDGFVNFIEIGAHPVLSADIRQNLADQQKAGVVVSSIRRDKPSMDELLTSLGYLWVNGYRVDWSKFYPTGNIISTPPYGWDHQLLWSESNSAEQDRIAKPTYPLLHYRQPNLNQGWATDLAMARLTYLNDHRLQGQSIFPASGYIEVMLEWLSHHVAHANTLEAVKFARLLNLSKSPVLQISHDEPNIFIHSHPVDDMLISVLNSQGTIVPLPMPTKAKPINRFELTASHKSEIYEQIHQAGYEYGEAFQAIQSIQTNHNTFTAYLSIAPNNDGYQAHPALLDAGFQGFLVLSQAMGGNGQIYLPVGLQQIRVHGSLPNEVWCSGELTSTQHQSLEGNLIFYDVQGTPLIEIYGLQFQRQATQQTVIKPEDWLYHIEQTPLTISNPKVLDGSWLVFGKNNTLTTKIVTTLQSPIVLYQEDFEGIAEKQIELANQIEPIIQNIDGIVYLWDSIAAEPASIGLTAVENGELFLDVIRALIGINTPHLRRFLVITTGSQPTHPAQMTVWGLGRVLANEQPEYNVVLINLDDEPISGEDILITALSAHKESELIFGNDVWNHNRFMPVVLAPDSPIQRLASQSAQLRMGMIGSIDRLEFEAIERVKPQADEVEIEVAVSAINFKDVMKVLNLLPESYLDRTFFGRELGLEFAGVITQLGTNVQHLQQGDRVVAMSNTGGFKTHAIAPIQSVIKIPDALSFENSVVFTNFVTAYYSLVEVGRLQAGETVLIHAASGGVGLAAIEIARMVGATVIATAGNDEKRDYLNQLGITAISDSRSLQFVDDVLTYTAQSGVDVVLNSLTGVALEKSFDLLKPFGRFIEIGKKDITENHRLAMSAFDRNVLFAAVDIDLMAQERPDKLLNLLETVRDLFAQNKIKPIQTKIFPASQIRDAFRLMSQSKHIGKIAIDMLDPQLEIYPNHQHSVIKSDKTYLVTGGFGGLGLSTVKWLAQEGAKYIAVLSRSGAQSNEAVTTLNYLLAEGVEVVSLIGNVANPDDIRSALTQITAKMPPLAGIIHSAMVLDDTLLSEMTSDHFRNVLMPKVIGAWELHQQTLTEDIDFFVMYSSISAIIGNPRQGNYVAANSFLDGLAHYRHSIGKPALSLNLGPIGRVGVVARNPKVEQYLKTMGLVALEPDAVVGLLPKLIIADKPQVAIVDIDWNQWVNSSMVGANSNLYQHFTENNAINREAHGDTFKHILLRSPQTQHETLLIQYLIEQIAKVTRLPIQNLDAQTNFDRIGMDSLMVLEMNNLIRMELGKELSVVALSQGPTIQQMAQILLEMLFQKPDA